MRNCFINRLSCYDLVENEKYIWFFDNEKNVLCEVEKNTGSITILLELDIYSNNSYSGINKVNDRLILTPWSAENILVYDLLAKTAFYIDLAEVTVWRKQIYNPIYKFWNSFIYKNCVYMLGFSYPSIIKLNVNTFEIEYINEGVDFLENRIKENDYGYFVNSVLIDNVVWISCGCSDVMIKFSLEDFKFEFFELNLSVGGLGVFICDGDYFWISEWGNCFEHLIFWNRNEDKTELYTITTNTDNAWCPIHSIIEYDDRIILFPFTNSIIYEMNKKSKLLTISELNECCNSDIYNETEWKIMSVVKNSNKVKFLTGDFVWHEYNVSTNEKKNFSFSVNNRELLNKYVNKKSNQKKIFKDDLNVLLFCLEVLSDKFHIYEENRNIGKIIYDECGRN